MRAIFDRSRQRTGFSVLVFLLTAVGCKSVSERRLLDTEGREFLAKCRRSGECAITQLSGLKRSDGKNSLLLSQTGRLIGICDVADGQTSADTPTDCRALVCQTDTDCPPSHGLKDGQCLNALCTDPAQPLVSQDSIMLCLAGAGLGRDQPRQIERYALGLNCGTPCKVPAPCRQP